MVGDPEKSHIGRQLGQNPKAWLGLWPNWLAFLTGKDSASPGTRGMIAGLRSKRPAFRKFLGLVWFGYYRLFTAGDEVTAGLCCPIVKPNRKFLGLVWLLPAFAVPSSNQTENFWVWFGYYRLFAAAAGVTAGRPVLVEQRLRLLSSIYMIQRALGYRLIGMFLGEGARAPNCFGMGRGKVESGSI